VNHVIEFVVCHGYAVLFFWILAEQSALPLPSIPLLLACGALARLGRLSPHLILFWGITACLVGDSILFTLGRRRGPRVLRFICRVALEPDSCVRRTETVFQRYGSRSLLISKFIPGLNAVAAPLAAMSGVRITRFLLFDTAGALIWIFSYTCLGYVFSNQLDILGIYAERMGSWVILLAAGLLAAWIGWKYFQRRRFLKGLAANRMSAEELKQKLEAGEEIVVVDVRSTFQSQDDFIPGAFRIPLEELEESHWSIPRDRDIVLVCT
jgi:membrane protein DedA with SNARE-associated domain